MTKYTFIKSLPVASLASLACIGFLTGCADEKAKPVNHNPIPLSSTKVPKSDYRIGPGDEIEVKFFFTPELNDRVTVRPDGNISLMFADDVKAAGLTTKQLTSSLKKKLAEHVKQLDLTVSVRSFGSQRVFVGGEVGKPGPITLTGNQTLMQVLDEAGWISPTGSIEKVVLIRRDTKGVEKAYPMDLSKVVNGEDVSQNILVMAGDTILVPPYGAVNFDRWMDRNVTRALPFTMNATVNRGVGP